MASYDGTARNSLGDLVQFVYDEDRMDGAFIERQHIDTFALDHKKLFEHNYRVDVTDPTRGFLSGVLRVGLDDSSLEPQAKLDDEFAQLAEDRQLLRTFVFPRSDPDQPLLTYSGLSRTQFRSSASTAGNLATLNLRTSSMG
jgi:DNA-directed RNA polymerase II subunit RPB1